nr:hypothetical protein [Mucilaginibacter sp. X5P1]
MKESKLSSLLSKLDQLLAPSSGSQNTFFIESLNEKLSRNLKGGSLIRNSVCSGKGDAACINSQCPGPNPTCIPGGGNATC